MMVFGVFIGYSFRRVPTIKKVSPLIHIVVCVLLFLLGLSIGLNRLIVSNLGYFCGQTAAISSLSVMGSLLASFLVYQHFFKKRGISKKGCIKTVILTQPQSRTFLFIIDRS